jgi:regulator of replication initiation timing
MLVTKKRLYTELCRIADILIEYGNVLEDIRETHLEDVMELNDNIHELIMKNKELEERIAALEAKRHHKSEKKTTKKKGK